MYSVSIYIVLLILFVRKWFNDIASLLFIGQKGDPGDSGTIGPQGMYSVSIYIVLLILFVRKWFNDIVCYL